MNVLMLVQQDMKLQIMVNVQALLHVMQCNIKVVLNAFLAKLDVQIVMIQTIVIVAITIGFMNNIQCN